MHRPRYDPFTQSVQHLHDLYSLGKELIEGSGTKEVKLLAEELAKRHVCAPITVKKAAQFASAYDADEFEELIALKRPDTDALGTGHLFVLMTISDPARRRELQKRVAHEGWSVRKLKEFLKGEGSQKYATNTKLGRKRKSPTTVKEALANLSQRSVAWLTAANDLKALFGKDGKHLRGSRSPEKMCLTALIKAIAAVNSLDVSANRLKEEMGNDDDSD